MVCGDDRIFGTPFRRSHSPNMVQDARVRARARVCALVLMHHLHSCVCTLTTGMSEIARHLL
jgi:hypothetical protein